MPATAGRVRMPANNRVHSSAALQTHGIWQSAIGYDPYAPDKNDSKQASKALNSSEPDAENAYASFQGLLALARITGSNSDEARGACLKCGRVGHLTFQCRNFLSVKVDDKEKDLDALHTVASALDQSRAKGADRKAIEESTEESSEESESSDSSLDLEIERIIAARSGKKSGRKTKSLSSKKRVEGSEPDSGEERKRGRSRSRRNGKRAGGDSEDEDEKDRKRRKERKKRGRLDNGDDGRRQHRKSKKERKSHGYLDDEDDVRRLRRKSRKENRRSHRRSGGDSDESESDGHRKQKKQRASLSEDYGHSSPDDSRGGRVKKRSEKRSMKHRR